MTASSHPFSIIPWSQPTQNDDSCNDSIPSLPPLLVERDGNTPTHLSTGKESNTSLTLASTKSNRKKNDTQHPRLRALNSKNKQHETVHYDPFQPKITSFF
jgi:hypothetical protein